MDILVACEESQVVTVELRKLGHEAYSCDIIPTSGNHPEWHIQQDVVPLLSMNWNMIIAFPPCTHLAASGARYWKQKQADGRQQKAINFFMKFVNADCPKIAIENPVGIMSRVYRKPNQYIEPYQFGEPYKKKTGLWLIGLPKLISTNIIKPIYHWHSGSTRGGEKKDGTRTPTKLISAKPWNDSEHRSKTFPGIAKAMARQWTNGTHST